jgi:SAM-dependent methyltransferase
VRQLKTGDNFVKPLDWEKCEVEVEGAPEQLSIMIEHVQNAWENYGRTEPHWSVLTNDKFKADVIGANRDAFYASGQGAIRNLRATAARCGIDLGRYTSCLELGCGVGRLTIWLAQQFGTVIAADISAPHLELAREAAAHFSRSNVSFVRLSSMSSLKEVEPFDVFFSLITLQHNPPPIIAAMLSEILNKLNGGGIAYFQIPTYKRGYRFKINEYIENFDKFDKMEMHAFPQDELFRLVERCNCVLLEVREDGYTGIDSGISNTILVRRREPVGGRPAKGAATRREKSRQPRG